jgi:CelD/BcsL family acetyltransferase involved in cellulose biosynthesis
MVGQTAETLDMPAPARAQPRISGTPALAPIDEPGEIRLVLHQDMAAAEHDWRRLEQSADCTPFQTFDWLSCWQHHVGSLTGVKPAIIVAWRGSDSLFVLPLAVEQGRLARRLTFLGQALCDYNAPLLARDFAARIGTDFAAVWQDISRLIQAVPALRYDTISFAKMPAAVGTQRNPMLFLDVQPNPSGAYETRLGTDWEPFYTSKRSSATRRRDRTKLKRLGELGEVKFVDPQLPDEIAATLDALIRQKTRSFARMGVPNMFARPGHAEFYRALITHRPFVHLSRLDVGATWAAANLALLHGDCYYHVLASYDDGEVSRFGPGAAHLRELLRYAIGRGCARFDFTIGDEPYKRDWCETEQQLYDHAAAVTLRGWPSFAITSGWRRAKRTIKQSALLWGVAVRLRTIVATLRSRPAPATKELAD